MQGSTRMGYACLWCLVAPVACVAHAVGAQAQAAAPQGMALLVSGDQHFLTAPTAALSAGKFTMHTIHSAVFELSEIHVPNRI